MTLLILIVFFSFLKYKIAQANLLFFSLYISLYFLTLSLLISPACFVCFMVRLSHRQPGEYCNPNRSNIYFLLHFVCWFHCATLSPKGWRWQRQQAAPTMGVYEKQQQTAQKKHKYRDNNWRRILQLLLLLLPPAVGVKLTREWDCIRRRRCPSSIHFHLSKCTS